LKSTDDVKTFMSPVHPSSSTVTEAHERRDHGHEIDEDLVVELQHPPMPCYTVLPELDTFPENSETAHHPQGLNPDLTPVSCRNFT
jgi:hypothetical protein